MKSFKGLLVQMYRNHATTGIRQKLPGDKNVAGRTILAELKTLPAIPLFTRLFKLWRCQAIIWVFRPWTELVDCHLALGIARARMDEGDMFRLYSRPVMCFVLKKKKKKLSFFFFLLSGWSRAGKPLLLPLTLQGFGEFPGLCYSPGVHKVTSPTRADHQCKEQHKSQTGRFLPTLQPFL